MTEVDRNEQVQQAIEHRDSEGAFELLEGDLKGLSEDAIDALVETAGIFEDESAGHCALNVIPHCSAEIGQQIAFAVGRYAEHDDAVAFVNNSASSAYRDRFVAGLIEGEPDYDDAGYLLFMTGKSLSDEQVVKVVRACQEK